jgi:hypothetical protein
MLENQKGKSSSVMISVVVVVTKFSYLTPITLQSVATQNFKDYEIILVHRDLSPRELQHLKGYSKKSIKVHQTETEMKILNPSKLMNEGAFLASGRYIQFLSSGESYLSPHSLEDVCEELRKRKYPDLLCFAFLSRRESASTEVVTRSFSKDFLQEGKLPSRMESCFFSQKLFEVMQGFDERYLYRLGFDLMCRIFLQKEFHVQFCHRVETDYMIKKESAHDLFNYAWETLEVLRKHFGFWKGLRWFISQKHENLLILFWNLIKSSFLNTKGAS